MPVKNNRVALKRFKGVYYRESTTSQWRDKPDRCYWVLFTDSHSGKKQWEKCGWASEGWTPQAAQKRRNEILEQDRVNKYKPKQDRQKDKFTFGELADKYIEWAQVSKKSWRDDMQRYNAHLKPVLAQEYLKTISPLALERLKRDLQNKELAPATVKHCLVLVRQIFNKATAWGMFNGLNPIKQVKLPKLNNSRLRFLSYEEAEKLLAELARCSLQVHDQAILSLHCGLRFGEIAYLTKADLDFTYNVIQIRDPKGESRQAFMTEAVKEILQKRLSDNPTDFIFLSRNGGQQKSVSNAFDRAVDRLGFNNGIEDSRDKVVFHTLRHTFGSWLALQGTPIYTIKELMGHKTLAMTERYAHLAPDHKRDAIEQMINGMKEQKKGADVFKLDRMAE